MGIVEAVGESVVVSEFSRRAKAARHFECTSMHRYDSNASCCASDYSAKMF